MGVRLGPNDRRFPSDRHGRGAVRRCRREDHETAQLFSVPRSAGRRRLSRRLAGLTIIVVTITVGFATVAGAHEPVFVTASDERPAAGPLLEDGNHSFAVYGVLTEPGASRGFRSQLVAGQALVADLLVPDRSPERELGAPDLPRVTITWPDGTRRTLDSELRIPFDEPFSGTSYIRIAELREPASQTGVYSFSVTGRVPARFTLATGTVEGFGGVVRDAQPAPPGGLDSWYTSPPTTTSRLAVPGGGLRAERGATPAGDDDGGSAVINGALIALAVLAVATALVVASARRRRR